MALRIAVEKLNGASDDKVEQSVAHLDLSVSVKVNERKSVRICELWDMNFKFCLFEHWWSTRVLIVVTVHIKTDLLDWLKRFASWYILNVMALQLYLPHGLVGSNPLFQNWVVCGILIDRFMRFAMIIDNCSPHDMLPISTVALTQPCVHHSNSFNVLRSAFQLSKNLEGGIRVEVQTCVALNICKLSLCWCTSHPLWFHCRVWFQASNP